MEKLGSEESEVTRPPPAPNLLLYKMAGKNFAYDGEKALYTRGAIPQNEMEFTEILEVANTGDALRLATGVILRRQASKRCFLVQKSFHDDVCDMVDVGGVDACRGFHSSFRTTQSGLSLNMDVSSKMILTPGSVSYLIHTNQNLKDPLHIDWGKAKKRLKNMRMKARHNNMEFKIIGISEKVFNQKYFPWKMRSEDGSTEETVDITVYEYLIALDNSAYMPCHDVGKPERPSNLSLELCYLVSLKQYTKAFSSMQRASFVEKPRHKLEERIRTVTDAVKNYHYDDDPMLKACGISIQKQLTAFAERMLNAPMLKIGNGEDCIPPIGEWNFNWKQLLSPIEIKRWEVVNISARCDTSYLSRETINSGRNKGIHIDRLHSIIEEDHQGRSSGPVVRVENMIEQLKTKLPGSSQILLCVLPEIKSCDVYGSWKKKNLHEMGMFTQCISTMKIYDQYFANVLLKINSKLGGMKSLLAAEHIPTFPLLEETLAVVLGMDVSHGSPGQSDTPSNAAVVGSRLWPLITKGGNDRFFV